MKLKRGMTVSVLSISSQNRFFVEGKARLIRPAMPELDSGDSGVWKVRFEGESENLTRDISSQCQDDPAGYVAGLNQDVAYIAGSLKDKIL